MSKNNAEESAVQVDNPFNPPGFLWRVVTGEEFSGGDTIIPQFDSDGNLVALSHEYTKKVDGKIVAFRESYPAFNDNEPIRIDSKCEEGVTNT